MLKFLKYQLDNTAPLRRSAHDGLVLDPESATRGFRVTDPPPEKAGVCLSRSYRGILDEVKIHKHKTYAYNTIQVIK
jgi:hypothetical protein